MPLYFESVISATRLKIMCEKRSSLGLYLYLVNKEKCTARQSSPRYCVWTTASTEAMDGSIYGGHNLINTQRNKQSLSHYIMYTIEEHYRLRLGSFVSYFARRQVVSIIYYVLKNNLLLR